MRGGTIDFTTMATGLLSGLNKEFMIFDFPFLFKDFREAYASTTARLARGFSPSSPTRA